MHLNPLPSSCDQFPFTNDRVSIDARSFDRILISRLVLSIYHLFCLVQEKGGGKDRNTCISADDIFQYLFLFSSLSLFFRATRVIEEREISERYMLEREKERERVTNEWELLFRGNGFRRRRPPLTASCSME